MEDMKFNMQFIDEGYGITSHLQTVELLESPIKFEVEDLEEQETGRTNALAAQALRWYAAHQEKAKNHLAQALVDSFAKMRQEGEKHVPEKSFASIREQLNVPCGFRHRNNRKNGTVLCAGAVTSGM